MLTTNQDEVVRWFLSIAFFGVVAFCIVAELLDLRRREIEHQKMLKAAAVRDSEVDEWKFRDLEF